MGVIKLLDFNGLSLRSGIDNSLFRILAATVATFTFSLTAIADPSSATNSFALNFPEPRAIDGNSPGRLTDSGLLSITESGASIPDPQPTAPVAKIAIIIDDLGYSAPRSFSAVNLPGAVTISIIPHSPYAKEVAQRAHQMRKEVMLHIPMSNVHDKPLGFGALTVEMPRSEFMATLNRNLAAIPFIAGVNNHMGSELTQQRLPMQWLMSELKRRQLFFIDSRTSAQSLAWDVAREYELPSFKRDIFLDHDPDPNQITSQFSKLLQLANTRGYAVAIAHPHPETLSFLRKTLNQLSDNRFQLVSISQLLSSVKVQVTTQQASVSHSQN